MNDLKKQVIEIKFLIHDLRVNTFINDLIHYHVTLDTDLEIYNIEQAQILHSDDLKQLKSKAWNLRKAYQLFSNSVKSFSPDNNIFLLGRKYIEAVQDICELILNPLWGRFDKVITFLPEEARSVQSARHYRNCLRWICGVYYRIEFFFQELDKQDIYEEFDIGTDIKDFTEHVIYGYVVEKGRSKIEIRLENIESVVIGGSKPRFRRMYFNLVMNAVDAMQNQSYGIIRIGIFRKKDRVFLQVQDNGTGMYEDKIKFLLNDRESLDGELHSLGFVFVRNTVESFKGSLSIDSTIGKGTTITIELPCFPEKELPKVGLSPCSKYDVFPVTDDATGIKISVSNEAQDENPTLVTEPVEDPALITAKAEQPKTSAPPKDQGQNLGGLTNSEEHCGAMIYADYQNSKSLYPGCIFAIAINYQNRLETFSHKPYEEHWDIGHEDLNPMLYESVVRGRLEENQEKEAELILKEPYSRNGYFDLKSIPETEQKKELYPSMIRDEFILICRKLLRTGLPPDIRVHITNAHHIFGDIKDTIGDEPFPIEKVAMVELSKAS